MRIYNYQGFEDLFIIEHILVIFEVGKNLLNKTQTAQPVTIKCMKMHQNSIFSVERDKVKQIGTRLAENYKVSKK